MANGFSDVVEKCYLVEQFSRGNTNRIGDRIYGDYLDLCGNSFFRKTYDNVVNFAIIKDGDIERNIDYIKSLVEFCKTHNVKKLIHFSSIMVYNYQDKFVDETTSIEQVGETFKKGYGEIKIAVDQYLMQIKESLPFELVLVRPGYVLADDRNCPFIKKLPLGLSIIKGNFDSKQPIVRRSDIHMALIRIMQTSSNDTVYHLFPNDGMTKYKYAKNIGSGLIIPMPKCIFKLIPYAFMKIGILPKSIYSRFEGMYIESDFRSKATECKLNIKFE
ncbi:MAG: NAD(P)-dependent oxidoreductase [Rikenellaceae bacterium]